MREDAVRRGLSISEYGVTNVETRRGLQERGRGRGLRVPRLPADPAGAARELRRARGGAARRAAEARRAARRARRPAHALALVGRRQEHARARCSRRRRRAATSTTRSPTTRTTSATGGSHAQLEEIEALRAAVPEADDPRRRRGEHPLERRGRRGGRGSRAARLGRRLGAPGARLAADRARARGDAEPVRRRASVTSPAGGSRSARRATSTSSA